MKKLRVARYNRANELLASGDYAGAQALYQLVNGYKDTEDKLAEIDYIQADALLTAGDYAAARPLFVALGEHSDAKTKVKACDYLAAAALQQEGKLLENYKGFGSGTAAEAGKRYYYSGTPALKLLTFIPAADYQGTVELPYVAYDSDGNSVDGVLTIQVSRSYAKLNFSDLAGYSSAIPAIEFLRENNVIGGYSDGTFRPTAPTSRAAYAAMVCRLFGFKAEVTDAPYPDVSKDSWCAETAAAARKYGVIYGDKNGNFNPTASVTKQQAVVMLQRAMESAGKEVPTTSITILRNYGDSERIASYARSAMANMIALGVVEADYFGNLRPDAPITRAEMATILYRLLIL